MHSGIHVTNLSPSHLMGIPFFGVDLIVTDTVN